MAKTLPASLLGCFCLLFLTAVTKAQNDTGFISAIETNFATKDCYQYAFSGANVWQLVEAMAGIYGGSPDDVRTLFENARQNNINVIRFFPFGILSDFTLQTAPGVYNQRNWDAIDAIIQMASEAGVKLIIPFADNWTPVNGKVQYVSWAGETDPDSFFTNDNVKQLYKDHIKAMTEHVNSLTQVAYKDDPTILAWDLINEVRSSCNTSAPNISCTATATGWVQDWIEDMSQYVKSVDSNHMLTVGEEGFYPAGNPRAAQFNPGLNFAEGSGQDFVKNHSPSTIDFLATHIWVDNWQTNQSFCGMQNNPSCGAKYITAWINSHAEDAASLNKPFVIEEFGNSAQSATPDAAVRDSIFGAVYDAYKSSLESGQPDVKGVAFWQWVYSPGLNVSYSDASYAVITGDATWDNIIAPSFEATLQYNDAQTEAPNCTPGPVKASAADSALAPGSVAEPASIAPIAANTGRRLLKA